VLARGAPPWILLPFALEAVAAGVYALVPSPLTLTLLVPATAILTLLGVGFLVFFRDPPRAIGRDVVSPADGRVLAVDHKANSFSIFLSLLNVHVNRAPMGGVVRSLQHTDGEHFRADRPEAATRNERMAILLDTALGPVRLVQFSGAVARRIVPYIETGDRIRKGQRIGLIRFGSRVEMTLPKKLRITISPGQVVRAGETTVAEVAT